MINPTRRHSPHLGAVPRGAVLAPRWTDTNRELHGRDSAHVRASNPYALLLPQSPAASGFEHIEAIRQMAVDRNLTSVRKLQIAKPDYGCLGRTLSRDAKIF
ncbi:MAG: hypothetical protein JWM11_2317 [Planctomycetaceae bacterium]|nr:hypothetical protein [Planctomycetaceae bacterium]